MSIDHLVMPPLSSPPSASSSDREQAFHLLDDPAEWSAFSRPLNQGGGLWESNVQVSGMHCAACALSVENFLKNVPGIVSVQVSAASHRAQVVWSAAEVRPSQWMQAIQDSGYSVVPANDCFAGEQRKQETRKALWRWLVAGLCMMQVMMYAYPAYIASPGDLSDEMEHLLRWASWVLTLPVILFSCSPFFRNAWRDVVLGRIGMDLPVALGIAITFGVSSIGTFDPAGALGHAVYFDSLTMFVFFLLTGRWLELRMRDRTAGALEALVNRLPDSVERADAQGNFERVAARRIVVGDLLRVRPGEAFFADAVIELGTTLVDEALLTGESRPLPRSPGSAVIAGSHNLTGTVQVRVQRTGDATQFAQIVRLMEEAAASKPASAQLADRMAKPFLLAVLLAAAGAAAWWWSSDPAHALMVAVAVLVVTCPCALSLATPAAMLAAAGSLARNGVLLRSLQALDTLASVDTLVFDKTGTLTRDALVLGSMVVRPGQTESQVLAMAAALAAHSVHPVSRALVAVWQLRPSEDAWECSEATEQAGQGVAGGVRRRGVESSEQECSLRLGSATFCGLPTQAENSPRVFLSDEQGWLASFELVEDVRPQAATVVRELGQAGVQVHLLSGDSAASVARIAAQVGIGNAVGGCSPGDKLAYLRRLQASGRKVAMVGDGMNDGPVLAAAHVAFALGLAVPLAQAKADFVLLGEDLSGLLLALRLARRTRRIVLQNLWWALAYNAACVPLAVVGWLPAWAAGLGMAASSLLVVLNALRLSQIDKSFVET